MLGSTVDADGDALAIEGGTPVFYIVQSRRYLGYQGLRWGLPVPNAKNRSAGAPIRGAYTKCPCCRQSSVQRRGKVMQNALQILLVDHRRVIRQSRFGRF